MKKAWGRTEHCKRGHKRTEENTYWNRNKNMKSGKARRPKVARMILIHMLMVLWLTVASPFR